MPQHNTKSEWVTWSAEGHSVRISYPKALMNTLADEAWEGLQKVPRRGLEIGAVLFGTRSGDHIRIVESRPIACEHAKGPGFELSPNDEVELAKMLEQAGSDAALSGLEPVGWFHTHTRDDVFLSETDIALYNRFFPEPWQVALVLRPNTTQPTRGGFFFRDSSGSLRAEESYHEFTLERRSGRLPVGFDPSNPQVRSAVSSDTDEQSPPKPAGIRRTPAPPPERASFPGVEAPPPEPRRVPWKAVAAIAAVVLFALVFLLAPVVDSSGPPQIDLTVRDTNGQLRLEWNHQAPPVYQAQAGVLRILDGTNEIRLDLSREELLTGTLAYLRDTGDVTFHLELAGADGEPVNEIARFVGEPPPEREGDRMLRLDLEAEAERLSQQLESETQRNKELRETIERLQNR